MRRTLVVMAGLLALSSGCARGPNIATDALPLTRVVVYRNGVGYFERAGRVDADEVRFKMRQRMVGDFLATLAIVERGGSSVRAASFPLDVKNDPEPPPEPVDSLLKPWPRPEAEPDPAEKMREVVLSMDGAKHDLAIGYVAETPVWRPSYRLVVQDGGRADLQAWGIVQNLSGEDWDNVRLALVAGAPLAFQSTLGEPVIPQRPVVTDSGEVIAAVPTGVTTLEQNDEAPVDYFGGEEEKTAAEVVEDSDESTVELAREGRSAGGGARKKEKGVAYAMKAPAPPASEPAPTSTSTADRRAALRELQKEGLSQPQRMSALAAVAVDTGTTRYELPNPVTIPDESATMVLLISKSVPGEAVYLYAPDPGVTESTAHPFRVARFDNATTGMLERGPITVFERGSFLGQGVVEQLPAEATATVPFALERSLAVSVSTDETQRGARLHKIESGEIWVERDLVRKTTYKLKNGSREIAKVLVKHPRRPETRLYNPPAGTEDNEAQGHALIPLEVKANGRAELLVDERRGYPQRVDWLSQLADDAVSGFVADSRSDPKAVQTLSAAWQIRESWKDANDERLKLETEESQLDKDARETRLSLKAIEKNNQAADLRLRLTKRLQELSTRQEEVAKRLIEVRMAIGEQEVRFNEAIRATKIVSVPPIPTGK
jgi:hypothetical protein